MILADWITFLIALTASACLAFPVRALALHIGMVDQPGPRKIHVQPVPLLGGLAIYLGFVLAAVFAFHHAFHGKASLQIAGLFAGASLIILVGFLDDGGHLHHQVKLFAGMPCATLILWATGVRANLFGALIPGSLGMILDLLFTLVWITGIIAAFSILDHMDGLCAGVAALAAAFFALAATMTGQFLVRSLAIAVFGAALGFLLWNFNPAKLFMGDGGAMLLGFLVAALSVKIRPPASLGFSKWLVPVLILAVPVLDTALVSVSRSRRGLLPFASPGKDHTAHRLANLGLGTRGTVLLLYATGILGGLLALVLTRGGVPPSLPLLGLALAVLLAAIFLLERAPFEKQPRRR